MKEHRTVFVSRSLQVVVLVVSILLVVACGGQAATPAATNAPSSAATATAAPVAPTATPTTAPSPTTAAPSATPLPPTATSTRTPTATPTLAPTSAPGGGLPIGDARDAIIRAMRAQMTAGPFRTQSVSTSAGRTTERTIEAIWPSRFHLFNGAQEIIAVDDKAYSKLGGRWTLLPLDVNALVQSIVGSMSEDFLKSISDAKLVGPDVVNGTPTLVYTFKSSLKIGDLTVNSTSKLWVTVAGGLPIKSESEGELSGQKTQTSQTIEYDKNIKIEAPPLN